MQDTMTIGEFARCTGLSVSALRFYATRGLLEPVEIDSTSGYRRYGPDQVANGRLIRDLRRLEMPLREITAALQLTGTARHELISEHLRRLERIVDRARTVAHTIETTPTTKDQTMTTATLPAPDLVDAFDQVLPAAGTDP
ncbi:MAG: MerR family transcriptional regulator, partial [Actinomycetota bacterium]